MPTNNSAYEVLPLPTYRLDELRKNDLYNELIQKYGEENVINNYLVEVVILQEERSIYAEGGQKLHITKDFSGIINNEAYLGIEDVYKSTQSAFEKYLSAPINKLKSKLFDDVNLLGTVPVIYDHHEDMENKHGILLAGSLRLVTIDDKLHLLGKILLISPESKFNWVTGNWNQISPGILNNKIREISFVPISAQTNSTTLSSGELQNVINNLQNVNKSDIIANKSQIVKQNKDKDKLIDKEKQLNKLAKKLKLEKAVQKRYTAEVEQSQRLKEVNLLADGLIAEGVLGFNKKKTVESSLLNLSSGERNQVVDLIRKVGVKAPLLNKPKMVLIRGDNTVNRQERLAKFQQEHAERFTAMGKSAEDLLLAFEQDDLKYENTLNLSAGKGKIEVIEDKQEAGLDYLRGLASGANTLTDAEMAQLKVIYGKLNLANGETDGGGEVQPNNTQLSGSNEPATKLEPKQKMKHIKKELKRLKMEKKLKKAQTKCMADGETKEEPKPETKDEPKSEPKGE